MSLHEPLTFLQDIARCVGFSKFLFYILCSSFPLYTGAHTSHNCMPTIYNRMDFGMDDRVEAFKELFSEWNKFCIL